MRQSAVGVKFSALAQEDDSTVTTDVESSLDDISLDAESLESEGSEKRKGHRGEGHGGCMSNGISGVLTSFVPTFPFDQVFPAWSGKVWMNWGVFLELGMPGALSLFLEWGSYELMAMISGKLGTIELATHGVFMSTCAIIYMVPQAIADATAVIAGNYLGHGDPAEAKSVIALGMCYDMSIGLLGASLLLFVLRPYWGGIFTSDADVQAEVYAKLPIMFIYITVDSMKCITLNILRSTGRPQVTMIGNIFCCVCIMLPLGWYLAITLHYGLFGVWGAMSVGWFSATVVYMVVLLMTDWDFQAKEAARRISVDSVAPEEEM
jgi:MATE family multidrug resistance protein